MTSETLLYRQVHPDFVQDGFASSRAFRPNEGDKGLMSVYDGDVIEPDPAWRHYTGTLNRRSAGVTAVLVRECTAEGLVPRPDSDPFPEHAVVDFTDAPEKDWRKKSKKLQAAALTRGWLFRPPSNGGTNV